jgi:prevent-host-death family protein
MTVIRPISDLRNKTPEISKLCRESGEPVFITKNGVNELVVMSAATYERDQARLRLYELLAAAEDDVRKGDRGVSLKRLAAMLRETRA